MATSPESETCGDKFRVGWNRQTGVQIPGPLRKTWSEEQEEDRWVQILWMSLEGVVCDAAGDNSSLVGFQWSSNKVQKHISHFCDSDRTNTELFVYLPPGEGPSSTFIYRLCTDVNVDINKEMDIKNKKLPWNKEGSESSLLWKSCCTLPALVEIFEAANTEGQVETGLLPAQRFRVCASVQNINKSQILVQPLAGPDRREGTEE